MSMRLDFDFGDGRSAKAPPPRAGLALLAAGLAALSFAAWGAAQSYAGWRAAAGERDDILARLQAAAHRRMPTPTPAEGRGLREAQQLADALRAPWDDLLGTLEAGPAGDIALLALEPIPARHELRITGEARSYGAMLDYLGYLQTRPGLAAVALTGHQLQRQAPGAPVRFQMQARWGQP